MKPSELYSNHKKEQYLFEFKASLFIAIKGLIEFRKLKQQDVALMAGISQPRVSDLVNGKIDLFSVDSLLEIMHSLGYEIQLNSKVTNWAINIDSTVNLVE
tara:strand:+ start:28677 stop:28979 length:303 start_codon:yes stop_codon:yes gene_type:complete